MGVVPVELTGKVKLSNGSTIEFRIDPGHGWQQWGSTTSDLGVTVDLMDALVGAASEHLHDPDDYGICSECGTELPGDPENDVCPSCSETNGENAA